MDREFNMVQWERSFNTTKHDINIYNRQLDHGEILQDDWSKNVFHHHPAILDSHKKTFATIQILKRMQITNVFLLTTRQGNADI